jgi:hypothetical protein
MSFLPGAKRAKHQQELVPLSWYWEPPEVTERLLEEITFRGPIHDPCCGSGRIPIVARKFGYEVGEEVAAVVPVPMQCGVWRRNNLYRIHPPRFVLALADRPSMPPGGTDIKAEGGTMDYCWLVWERGYRGPTEWRPI